MNSIVKDVMLTNGTPAEAVVEKLSQKFGWKPEATKNWFETRFMDPKVTGKKVPTVAMANVRNSQWEEILEAIGATDDQKVTITAFVKELRKTFTSTSKDQVAFESAEASESAYEELYEKFSVKEA